MKKEERISQEQVYDIITGKELSWQSIIYELVRTEQLDPWDIDIKLLAERYLEVVNKLEEADFHVSSKVLLACSLLLRLKSEIFVNSFLEMNNELYGEDSEKKRALETLNLDEDELPLLLPKSPISRNRPISIEDLMRALEKAIDTENRRIKRKIRKELTEKEIMMILPKNTRVPLKVRMRKLLKLIRNSFRNGDRVKFSSLAKKREEKIAGFIPILHLSNEGKIYLWQEKHFDDIEILPEVHYKEKEAIEKELEPLG